MSLSLSIDSVVSMPFGEVSYIVSRPGSADCFVVDPGFEPDLILDKIANKALQVIAILNTHGHVDHIAGNAAMKEEFPEAPLIIGAGDEPMLTNARLNLSALGGADVVSPPADRTVKEGERLELLGLEWDVLEIPGHSPGHVVFVWSGGSPPIVFGGDVLFQGGIGRYDFPRGDGRLLLKGIREKLYTLPGETIVYPGHGGPTRIADEIAHNPFTQGAFPLT